MNQQNYASLEASKRLVDAGIVLETDFFWIIYNNNILRSFRDAGKEIPQPYLADRKSFNGPSKYVIPAPSMAEVWRELPEVSAYHHLNGQTEVWLEREGKAFPESDSFASHNPTDTLIDLLIWVRKEVK